MDGMLNAGQAKDGLTALGERKFASNSRQSELRINWDWTRLSKAWRPRARQPGSLPNRRPGHSHDRRLKNCEIQQPIMRYGQLLIDQAASPRRTLQETRFGGSLAGLKDALW